MENNLPTETVLSKGRVLAQEDFHGHEYGAQLCGIGGFPIPGVSGTKRIHSVGIPYDDELWEDDQGYR